MKKTILLAAGAVLLAATVSTFVYVKNGSDSMDELFKANVEALTNDEGFEYENGSPIVTTCGVLIGENFWGKQYCQATLVICQGGGKGCNERGCPIHG